MPDSNIVLREDLDKVESRLSEEIRENRTRIAFNSEAIVKLETLYGTLVKLPETIDSLKETCIGIQANLQAMNDKFNHTQEIFSQQQSRINELQSENKKQDEHIDRVANKGKIDWIDFVTENFWKVLLAVGILYMIVKDMIA